MYSASGERVLRYLQRVDEPCTKYEILERTTVYPEQLDRALVYLEQTRQVKVSVRKGVIFYALK